jgi:hypothetical protein
MTRFRRMAVVDAWLRSDQSMMGFAQDHAVDLFDLRDWVMEYGQPPDPLRWIPVRILGPFVENRRIDEGFPVCCPPGITSARAVQRHWVPVVIQERP